MAKTIALEFTDAQWELIKEHYVTFDSQGMDVDFTDESFSATVKVVVGRKVSNTMNNKTKEANQNSYDV